MVKNKTFSFGFLFLVILGFSLSGASPAVPEAMAKIVITINGHGFTVEVADTPEKRNWGFMERETIGPDEGMIFVFPQDSRLSFWMKNTPTALSIAFIDSRGTIREIRDMEPFSQRSVESQRSVRYALEVPQGRFEELGITVGSRVEFSGGTMPQARR